jgi:hypothetical protein
MNHFHIILSSHPRFQLELDDLNIESAYFRSFEAVVRRQLDPVWHKVGPRTKQLVNDLSTLRQLLTFVFTVLVIILLAEILGSAIS